MSRADHAGAARRRIERDTHRGHERTRPEDTPEIVVHRLHDFRRLVVFHAAVMKEQLGQRGEERGGSAMSGGVRDPEQGSAIGHAQPAIDIAADLNHRPIDRRRYPSPAAPAAFAE